jgi:hypothetical protein
MPVQELVRLPLSAHWLERVRNTVSEALGAQPREVRAAGLLAASELAENVLKFGRPTPDAADGCVRVSLVDGELRVISESGALPERYRSVAARIERIASCAGPELLYVECMNQLLRSPGAESVGLGLVRVAHEGAFTLSCSYDEPKLTIVAARRLPPLGQSDG